MVSTCPVHVAGTPGSAPWRTGVTIVAEVGRVALRYFAPHWEGARRQGGTGRVPYVAPPPRSVPRGSYPARVSGMVGGFQGNPHVCVRLCAFVCLYRTVTYPAFAG